MSSTAVKKSKPSLKARKARLLKYLSSVKVADIFPEKNKQAAENLKRAGLIK